VSIALDGIGVLAFNCGAPVLQLTRERPEADIDPRLSIRALSIW
jgi:hypothetical protein